MTTRAPTAGRSLWKLEEQFTLGLPVKLSLAETAALVMSHHLLRPAGAGALGAAFTSTFALAPAPADQYPIAA